MKLVSYTVILFDTDPKHVTPSAKVRQALKRIKDSDRKVIAVGGEFTTEAMSLFEERQVEVLSSEHSGWTDGAYEKIKIQIGARVKKRFLFSDVKIEHNPSVQHLQELGVEEWPTWEKEVSEFPWHYDEEETCFFLEGDVIVQVEDRKPVRIGKGDLVTFPKGLSCTWEIHKPVRKHYKFG